MEQLQKLADERAVIWERMQELAFGGDGGLSNEDVASYREAEQDLDEITAKIDVLESANALKATEDQRKEVKIEELAALPEGVLDGTLPTTTDEVEDREAVYADAFNTYMRFGMKAVEPEARDLLTAEFRALGTAPGAVGGFTIPEGFIASIEEARLAFGGVLNAGITRITTSEGNDIPIPTNDDTGNVGQLLSENTAVPEQDTVFGQKVLKAWTWTSKMVKVPLQLLQDSAFDMDAFLSRILGMRIGRAQAAFWAEGTGTNEPEGILTGVGTEAAQAAAALEYQDFVNLEHSIDPAYRNVGEYVISDDFLKKARLITDLDDRPIWAPGINVAGSGPGGFTSGLATSINGFKYTVDVNFPDATTALKPAVFGDLSAYWVRDVLGTQMLRLDERFADSLQVAFLAYSRSDGRQVDAGDDPYKALLMA